jgi:phosphoenolpyruvate carboxykinase (GTP)
MADYFAHWVKIGKKTKAEKLPKIFFVNWFRKNAEGKFIWPGYGENSRVLAWIFDRCDGKENAIETAIGFMPKEGSLNISGLEVTPGDLKSILSVDTEGWKKEIADIRANHYPKFGKKLPKELMKELDKLEMRING